MATILSIETATTVCSVALHEGDTLLGCQDLYLEKSHSTLLNILIDDLLQYGKVDRGDLDAVAVSKGPGSYTGLRIGTSSAKGLCFGLDIPLIGVNTLEAMAIGMNTYNTSDALLCPMIDARRMEVYCLVMDSKTHVVEPTRALVVDENAFKDLLDQKPVVFFGNGASKCKALLEHHPHAKFVDDMLPSARWVGKSALEKFKKHEFEDLAYFTPFYLKEFRTTKPNPDKASGFLNTKNRKQQNE